jgi:hypothetical protein
MEKFDGFLKKLNYLSSMNFTARYIPQRPANRNSNDATVTRFFAALFIISKR